MADYNCIDMDRFITQMKERYGNIDMAENGRTACCSAENAEEARQYICDSCPIVDDCDGPVEVHQDTPGQMTLFPEEAPA